MGVDYWGNSFCSAHHVGTFCSGFTQVRCCRASWGFVRCGSTAHFRGCGWRGAGWHAGGWHAGVTTRRATTAQPQQHQHLCIVAESKPVVAAVGIFEDAAALVRRPVVVLAEGLKEGVDMSLVDAFGFALGFWSL